MKRETGVLLSVTSLPSRYGIGCFSREAYAFVDYLAKHGQRYWQILPLGATSHGGAFDSPYQAFSAFAGNPYFISLEALIEEGVLTREECDSVDFGTDPGRVDYEKMYQNRLPLLRKAYERSHISENGEYQQFLRENGWWLEDYALFMAVKEFFGGKSWVDWPQDIRMHYGPALDYYHTKLYFDVEFHKYLQFQFFVQWSRLKRYANERHVKIVGDMPIYVSQDGSDIWAHPEMFQLDGENRLTLVAGCPPDSFAKDGQVWGNPLYRWEFHRNTGFDWWISRMRHSYRLYDVVRIDHFRGFDEYFAIPAGEDTARNGRWMPGPGMELFYAIRNALGETDVIAEDLGLMTPGVRKLVLDSGFPNMKVIQFAFDRADIGGANDYLPHNYSHNCWVYTGTHDNDTLSGWFASLTREDKQFVREYLDDPHTAQKRMHHRLISLAMESTARVCIVPLQDWLGLGSNARMNRPGTTEDNWTWRMSGDVLTEELGQQMCAVAKRYGRANWDALKFFSPDTPND